MCITSFVETAPTVRPSATKEKNRYEWSNSDQEME
jgi:hypothetical protein